VSDQVDLLVIGGGIAGTAAAAEAARLGASVTVVEKGERLGGSGALSAGILWTAPDRETLRRICPRGDPELGGVLVDGFEGAVERVRAEGVDVSERWFGQMGFGVAHRIDIHGLLDAWRKRIEAAGTIAFETAAIEPIIADGAVRGAHVRGPGGTDALHARAVVLATGGFQGDADLRRRLIGPEAAGMLVRSNPHSTGDGFRIGLAAGAARSGAFDSFYGHLLPSPLRSFGPDDYLPLTQYHSKACVLVNGFGGRFVNESRGDEVSNQALLRQPGSRGVLLCDERARTEHAVGAPYPHGQVVNRLAVARDAGARLARAETVEALVEAVSAWGVSDRGLRATLAAASSELRDPPFWGLEVQPSITFTFGGLRADRDGRALAADGAPVPGLFVAGADMGGLQETGYVGGLILGLVFGPRAAAAALGAGEPRPREAVARG
jgi:succinate dehydrogenase/fumarate reductase flavoprotein subunit